MLLYLLWPNAAWDASLEATVIWPWEERWWLLTLGAALAAGLLGGLLGLGRKRSTWDKIGLGIAGIVASGTVMALLGWIV